MEAMKNVTLYTDGACSGNPGFGGYAAILRLDGSDYEKVITGGEDDTTNNQMELMAVIAGFEALKRPCRIKVMSDSAYVVNAHVQGWLAKWQSNEWLKKDGSHWVEVANKNLWQRLLQLEAVHKVEFVKVAGHATDAINNRCDRLAQFEAQKRRASAK